MEHNMERHMDKKWNLHNSSWDLIKGVSIERKVIARMKSQVIFMTTTRLRSER